MALRISSGLRNCLAANSLDYFGQTVNIAARVQGLAGANEIYVTSEAHNSPGVDEVLAGCEVLAEQANVKGVSEQLDVAKVIVRK